MKLYILNYRLLNSLLDQPQNAQRLENLFGVIHRSKMPIIIVVKKGEKLRKNYTEVIKDFNKNYYIHYKDDEDYLPIAVKLYNTNLDYQIVVLDTNRKAINLASKHGAEAIHFDAKQQEHHLDQLEMELNAFLTTDKIEISKLASTTNAQIRRNLFVLYQNFYNEINSINIEQIGISFKILALKIQLKLFNILLSKKIKIYDFKLFDFYEDYQHSLEQIVTALIQENDYHLIIERQMLMDLGGNQDLLKDNRALLKSNLTQISNDNYQALRNELEMELSNQQPSTTQEIQKHEETVRYTLSPSALKQLKERVLVALIAWTKELGKNSKKKQLLIEKLASKIRGDSNAIDKSFAENKKLTYLRNIAKKANQDRMNQGLQLQLRKLTMKVIRLLGNKYINLLMMDDFDNFPLHLACYLGDIKLVNWLIEKGADINCCTSDGSYILHKAAYSKDKTIAAKLLQMGARINVQDLHGRTPLYIAACGGNIELVKLFLAKGANPNIKEFEKGETALHAAVWCGRREVVTILLQYMQTANQCDNFGYKAVGAAITIGDIETTQQLLQYANQDDLSEEDYRLLENEARQNQYAKQALSEWKEIEKSSQDIISSQFQLENLGFADDLFDVIKLEQEIAEHKARMAKQYSKMDGDIEVTKEKEKEEQPKELLDHYTYIPFKKEEEETENSSSSDLATKIERSRKPTLFSTSFPVQKIPLAKISRDEKIGQGYFGCVWKASWEGSLIALKELKQLTEKEKEQLKEEATIMAQLAHPNIVQFFGVSRDIGGIYVIMEYMPKGSLRALLNSGETISNQLILKLAYDIGKGLTYLHSRKFLHRDIKAANVLLTEQYQAKLSDFGLTRKQTKAGSADTDQQVQGSLKWMAPELLTEKDPVYTTKCDVYSFGLTLWEIITRKIPYADLHNKGLVIAAIVSDKRMVVPATEPKELGAIATKCIDKPENRPTAAEATQALCKIWENRNKSDDVSIQATTSAVNFSPN